MTDVSRATSRSPSVAEILIEEHNKGCEAACEAQRPNERQSGGCGYQRHDGSKIYSRRCPTCPKDWKIDVSRMVSAAPYIEREVSEIIMGWHNEDEAAHCRMLQAIEDLITNAAPQVPEVREAPGNLPIASSPAVAAPGMASTVAASTETDNDIQPDAPGWELVESARKNARYWESAARNEHERESALQHLHQAMLAYKNCAYYLAGKLSSSIAAPVAWRWRRMHGGNARHWAYGEERPTGPGIGDCEVEPLFVASAIQATTLRWIADNAEAHPEVVDEVVRRAEAALGTQPRRTFADWWDDYGRAKYQELPIRDPLHAAKLGWEAASTPTSEAK